MKKILFLILYLPIMAQAQGIAITTTTPTTTTKKAYYIDSDLDGYGDPFTVTYKRKQPEGTTLTGGDCNDKDGAIHPGASEGWNNIDDNCSGQIDEGIKADLTIITTKSPANPQLASLPLVDLFFTGGWTPRNVTEPMFAALVKGSGARCLSSTTGGYANYVHIYPQKTMYGVGNGYNITVPQVLQNVGPQDFRINGQPYDFAKAGDSLRHLLGMTAIMEVNIATATIEETYTQIDRAIATGQKYILIQFGSELVNDKSFFADGKIYAAKVDDWITKIKTRYPLLSFDFCLDTGVKWVTKDSEKVKIWNEQAGATSKLATAHDDYFDLMYLTKDGGFTGDISHDTAQVSYAITSGLDLQINKWRTDPTLKRYKLSVTQLIGAVNPYSKQVIKNQFITASYLPGAIMHLNAWNASHGDSIISATVMSLKDMIGANNTVTVDYKLLSVCYSLFTPGAFTCNITGNYPGTDLGATVGTDGIYTVVMQNRTGRDYTAPVNISLDGQHVKFAPITATGYACDSFTSTTAIVDTDPTKITARSIKSFKIQ